MHTIEIKTTNKEHLIEKIVYMVAEICKATRVEKIQASGEGIQLIYSNQAEAERATNAILASGWEL